MGWLEDDCGRADKILGLKEISYVIPKELRGCSGFTVGATPLAGTVTVVGDAVANLGD